MEIIEVEQIVAEASTTNKEPSLSDDKESGVVDVDDVLEKGGLGRFQYLTFLLIGYTIISFSYNVVLSYFITNDPAWRCIRNDTSQFCEENFGRDIESDSKMFSKRCILGREEWTYTTDKTYSIVTEFDLVCDKASVAALISSSIHIGGIIGMLISGTLADSYGRKYVMIIFLCIVAAAGVACSFITKIWQLIVLRAFIGAGHTVCYCASFVYMSEIVPPKFRALICIGLCTTYVFSECFINVTAYALRKWRDIQLYVPLSCLLGIVLLFLLPKSPRWLMVHEKQLEAESVLRKIASFNGKELSQFTLRSADSEEQEERYTYRHLLQNRKVTGLTLTLGLLWFTISLAYYTLAFESSNLGGDMYQAFLFTTLAEIPSKFVAYYVCDHFGRKKTTLISIALTGTFGAATILVPKTYSYKYIVNIVFAMLGKFFADINWQGIYVWTFELYPTVIRMQGLAIGIFFERAGSFGAPFLTNVLHPINPTLPYIILLVFAVATAGFGAVFLDETNKQPTRERYEDIFVKPSFNRSQDKGREDPNK